MTRPTTENSDDTGSDGDGASAGRTRRSLAQAQAIEQLPAPQPAASRRPAQP